MPRRKDKAPTLPLFEEPPPVLARFEVCYHCVHHKACRSHQTCLIERERFGLEMRNRQVAELQRQKRHAELVKNGRGVGVWDGSE